MQKKKSNVNTTKNVSSSKNAQNKFWHTKINTRGVPIRLKGKMVEAAAAETAGAADTAAAAGARGRASV